MEFEVDSDMASYVKRYVQIVQDYAKGGTLLVEQRLPIGHLTGEENATGTADAVVLLDDEIVVIDLKYGRGVEVSAENNPQLKLYALGALQEYEMLGDFKRVRLVICQPRASHDPSEWAISVEDLQRFAGHVKERAFHALNVLKHEQHGALIHHLREGDVQCKFCKAKAKCPKLAQFVQTTLEAEFTAIPETLPADVATITDDATLSQKMAACDLIEEWIAAIRAKVAGELNAGRDVPGYKLVQGKKGNRAWTDEAVVEELLKTMRVGHDKMYQYKVISPTTAEKLAKENIIGPRQWPRLQPLITRTDGKPSVAPITDKRPALVVQPMADEFVAIESPAADLI